MIVYWRITIWQVNHTTIQLFIHYVDQSTIMCQDMFMDKTYSLQNVDEFFSKPKYQLTVLLLFFLTIIDGWMLEWFTEVMLVMTSEVIADSIWRLKRILGIPMLVASHPIRSLATFQSSPQTVEYSFKSSLWKIPFF